MQSFKTIFPRIWSSTIACFRSLNWARRHGIISFPSLVCRRGQLTFGRPHLTMIFMFSRQSIVCILILELQNTLQKYRDNESKGMWLTGRLSTLAKNLKIPHSSHHHDAEFKFLWGMMDVDLRLRTAVDQLVIKINQKNTVVLRIRGYYNVSQLSVQF